MQGFHCDDLGEEYLGGNIWIKGYKYNTYLHGSTFSTFLNNFTIYVEVQHHNLLLLSTHDDQSSILDVTPVTWLFVVRWVKVFVEPAYIFLSHALYTVDMTGVYRCKDWTAQCFILYVTSVSIRLSTPPWGHDIMDRSDGFFFCSPPQNFAFIFVPLHLPTLTSHLLLFPDCPFILIHFSISLLSTIMSFSVPFPPISVLAWSSLSLSPCLALSIAVYGVENEFHGWALCSWLMEADLSLCVNICTEGL